MNRRTVFFVLAVAMVLALAAGCSIQGEQPNAADQTTPSASTQQDQQTPAPEQEDKLDYDAMHEANIQRVIDHVNAGICGDLGYTIDSQEEIDSIEFYDMYFTREYKNKESNDNNDIVVRYTFTFDEYDYAKHDYDECGYDESMYSLYYTVEESYFDQLLKDYRAKELDLILNSLYKNRDLIQESGGMASPKIHYDILKRAEGSRMEFNKSFMEYVINQAKESASSP